MQIISRNRSRLRNSLALVTLGLLFATAAPVKAHADWHRDGDWRGHEARGHAYWHGHYRDPRAVYAPPVVYSAPPVEESPGFNLVLPIHIR